MALSDDTTIKISAKWMLTIASMTCVALVAGGKIVSSIDKVENKLISMETELKLNSEFRHDWPLGKLGQLPADMRQDFKIDALEARLKDIEKEVKEIKDELHRIELSSK